jgi:hypothetical protein
MIEWTFYIASRAAGSPDAKMRKRWGPLQLATFNSGAATIFSPGAARTFDGILPNEVQIDCQKFPGPLRAATCS